MTAPPLGGGHWTADARCYNVWHLTVVVAWITGISVTATRACGEYTGESLVIAAMTPLGALRSSAPRACHEFS